MRALGHDWDNACLLAIQDFLAAEIAPVGDDMEFITAIAFWPVCHVGELVTVMADVGDFMGDDEVVLGVDGSLDVVTDHPSAPAAGGHRPGIRVSKGDLLVRRFLQLGFNGFKFLHLLFQLGNLFL